MLPAARYSPNNNSFRSWLKLPTPLLSYAPSVPSYSDGSKSSEGVGCAAVFPDFDVFISLPVVALICRAELFAIFLALPRISFHDSTSFVIYSDSEVPYRPLGAFIHAIP